ANREPKPATKDKAVTPQPALSQPSNYRGPEVPNRLTPPRIVAIGSSTGGPSALATLLGQLPRDFDLPILITQHIMPGFGEGLAHWLKEVTRRPVMMAQEGMQIKPNSGMTILAPDHCHL